VSIIGPSGCGKSTMLNIIAGLVPSSAGTVELAGRSVVSAERQRTPVGYVFQQPRLLSWLTVRQNVEFALEAGDVPRGQWPARVERALRLVGLDEYAGTFPLRLSGGQQQRVAIARALATEPEVVLMDEPFSHLDEITSTRLRAELMEIWARTRTTILFVTHDISEAALLSDRVIVLGRGGRVLAEQAIDVDRPRAGQEDRLFEIERAMRVLATCWWSDGDRPAEVTTR
jgi:NitT/TauT family transport system ATP-binding protein